MSGKAELLDKANQYLEHVKRIIKSINEQKPIHASLETMLNLPLLLRIENAFTRKYLPDIESLSDEFIKTESEESIEEQSKIRIIESALGDIIKIILEAEKKLTRILSDAEYKKKFELSLKEQEFRGIQDRIGSLPKFPATDEFNNEAYQTAHKRFIKAQEAYETLSKALDPKPCKTVVDYELLILQGHQLLEFHTRVNEEYRLLKKANDHYRSSLSEAEKFLSEWSTMNAEVLSELKTYYPRSDLGDRIDAFQKELAQMSNIITELNVKSPQLDARRLHENSNVILFLIEERKKNKINLEQAMRDAVQASQQQIKDIQASFSEMYQTITQQMHEVSQSTEKVDAIKDEFNTCLQLNSENDQDILFYGQKMQQLRTIIAKLQKGIAEETPTIREKLDQKIREVQLAFIEKYEHILENFKALSAQIPADKHRPFVELAERLAVLKADLDRGAVARLIDAKTLVEKRLQLLKDASELAPTIADAEGVIGLYTTISTLSQHSEKREKVEFITLLQSELNKASGQELLSALYDNLNKKAFETLILESIGTFNTRDLKKLKTLFEHNTNIKEKIDFIQLLTDQRLDAKLYLNDQILFDGVMYLRSHHLLNLSEQRLSNISFWQAIHVFKKLDRNISREELDALGQSADLCTVIVKQYEKYDEQQHGTELNAFISNIVKQDESTIKALMAASKRRDLYASNLALITQSPILKQIFSNTDEYKLNQAACFFNHLLKHALDEETIKNYFSTIQNNREQAVTKIRQYLEKNLALLENLQNALKNPSTHHLRNMSLLFARFNQWSDDYVRSFPEEEKQKMVRFREAMASILLTNKTPGEKQKQVEVLAKQHFASKIAGLICLADVLLAIITLFIPYFITGHFFFSGGQTKHQKAIDEQVKKDWNDIPHSSEEEAPLLGTEDPHSPLQQLAKVDMILEGIQNDLIDDDDTNLSPSPMG